MKRVVIATLIWIFCLAGSGLCEDVFFPIVAHPQDGTAQQSDVRAGKYFYGLQGKRQVGTVPANSISADTDVVPQGIYPRTELTEVDPDLKPENIKEGVTIFGQTGSVGAVTCSEYCTKISIVLEAILANSDSQLRNYGASVYSFVLAGFESSLGIDFEESCPSCD